MVSSMAAAEAKTREMLSAYFLNRVTHGFVLTLATGLWEATYMAMGHHNLYLHFGADEHPYTTYFDVH